MSNVPVIKGQWWAVTSSDVYAYRNGIIGLFGFLLQRGMFVEILDAESRIVDNFGPFYLVRILRSDFSVAHERVLVKAERFGTGGLTFRFTSKNLKPLPTAAVT